MGAYYFAATLWALELRFYYFVILGWDWVWHGRCFMTFAAGAALDAEAAKPPSGEVTPAIRGFSHILVEMLVIGGKGRSGERSFLWPALAQAERFAPLRLPCCGAQPRSSSAPLFSRTRPCTVRLGLWLEVACVFVLDGGREFLDASCPSLGRSVVAGQCDRLCRAASPARRGARALGGPCFFRKVSAGAPGWSVGGGACCGGALEGNFGKTKLAGGRVGGWCVF